MLYPCRECGAQISDQARRCPHCGCKRSKIKPKPPEKSRTIQSLEAIGGLVGILIVIGLFTDFYGIPEYLAKRDYRSPTPSTAASTVSIENEVERYVIRPCLIAFLELDPAYRRASNKEARLRAFQNDPRIDDVLEFTVRNSVSAVRRVAEAEDRKAIYETLLATCKEGAR